MTETAVPETAVPETAVPETARPSCSVVICCYTDDRWNDLVRAVDSIRAQTVPCEMLVVVDHNDALLTKAELAFQGTLVIPNKQSQGLSGARNTGVAAATTDVVAFLDDDASAPPNWLAVMLEAYQDPRVLGTGTAVEAVWPVRRPAWFPPEFDWVVGCSYVGLPTQPVPVRNPIGAAMSFRRTVFDQVAGFSSDLGRVGTLPLGCEETDFCIRLSQAEPDGVIVYEPSAEVLHRVTAQRTTVKYFVRRCFAEGISKAAVGGRVGNQDALSTERDYVRRTLPRAVSRGLKTRGERARAGAVVLGLAATALGFASGSARARIG